MHEAIAVKGCFPRCRAGTSTNARADSGRDQVSSELDALDRTALKGVVTAVQRIVIYAVNRTGARLPVSGNMDPCVQRKLFDPLPVGPRR
jgi:hypothetical protein